MNLSIMNLFIMNEYSKTFKPKNQGLGCRANKREKQIEIPVFVF